jgi:hypothetical protein
MALQITNNRAMLAYLNSGNFLGVSPIPVPDFSLDTTTAGTARLCYIDKLDLVMASLRPDGGTGRAARWDPNLIDSTSSSVGWFVSPVGQNHTFPFFTSDFVPSTGGQRLFQANSFTVDAFVELNMAAPTLIVDSDAFPTVGRRGNQQSTSPFPATTVGAFDGSFEGGLGANWVFFPEMGAGGYAVVLPVTCWADIGAGPVAFVTCCVGVDLQTGAGTPLIPCAYGSGEHVFNRGPAFGETQIDFSQLQFMADDESTGIAPKGELFLTSRHTSPGGNDSRQYVRFVDFNPFGVAGVPNRIHLRETLFSRLDLLSNTEPTGGPPQLPINAYNQPTALLAPLTVFTARGSRRIVFESSLATGAQQPSTQIEASRAALPTTIGIPSPKGAVVTNREVSFQAEVLGSLGEQILNAPVDFTIERLTTMGEILATTGTPNETVTVANVPIDREVFWAPGFEVFEDSGGGPVALTETTHYTVDAGLGEITFISPHTIGGSVYTIQYAHTAAPATPAHGSILDPTVLSDVGGVATSRVLYPDDDALADQIDQVTADTPT